MTILQKLMADKGVSQYRLARDTGIPKSTVNSWFKKQNVQGPSDKHLDVLSQYFGISKADLRYGTPENYHKIACMIVQIPVVKNAPDDRAGSILSDVIKEYASFPDLPKDALIMLVKDNAMSPQINEGSYAVLRINERYEHGNVVVINNEWGESIIRRYRKAGSQELFCADNPEWPELRPEDGYRVIAKVIETWQRRKV